MGKTSSNIFLTAIAMADVSLAMAQTSWESNLTQEARSGNPLACNNLLAFFFA